MRPKILYLITEDWFFCSHFMERALAARQAGYEVAVLTRAGSKADDIRASGIRLHPVDIVRRGGGWRDVHALRDIARIYRAEKPDIVHHVALKAIVLGSVAARLAGVPALINAPTGLGYVFSSADKRARLLRPLVGAALRSLLTPAHGRIVFENSDDLELMVANGTVRRERSLLIRGAGIDVERLQATPEPAGPPVVLLGARMLVDKGIEEFVEAARALRSSGVAATFLLAGAPDPGNPASIAAERLHEWHREGWVQWLGHRDDIPELLARSHIVCLPSYREGLPKSLLEALAAGRPVVTTDVPGCREVVAHMRNGLLVPARNAKALAGALRTLIADGDLRRRLGHAGRLRAESEFASSQVTAQTVSVYRSLCAP
jgi:glycosyltransferase involved in cell wall biosynthesis